MKTRFLLLIAALFGAGASFSPLDAQKTADTFTLDLPVAANAPLPAWLGQPATPSGTFATLDVPITPPDGTAALLVTVTFQEQNGGFLRMSWQGAPAPTAATEPVAADLPGPGETTPSSVLCANFYEGIGMDNQRSLLIPAEAMHVPGGLHFQTGGTTLGISRIRLEWLTTSTGLTSSTITDILVTTANGSTRPATELNGQPVISQDPAWHEQAVDVPLTDTPVRIEQGVDFTVQTQGVPKTARLALKENGLPWGQHLVVWLNNQRAGILVPATPELGDPGYSATADATYIGWRAGTFHIPAGILAAGNNTLQVSAEPDASAQANEPAPAPTPLALKDVVLQLGYPVAPTVATAPSAAPDAVAPNVSAADDRLTPSAPPGAALLSLPPSGEPTAQLPESTTP